MTAKTCPRCAVIRLPSEFYVSKTGKADLVCSHCRRQATRLQAKRKREQMGTEEWLAERREAVARSRQALGRDRGKPMWSTYQAALRTLRELHREDYDAIYATLVEPDEDGRTTARKSYAVLREMYRSDFDVVLLMERAKNKRPAP